METIPEMTMTVLDRALVAGDAGQVAGERRERPGPGGPEKGRRRAFTPQDKLGVVAEDGAAAGGGEGGGLRRAGRYSSHGGGGGAGRAAVPHRDRVQPRALAGAERQAILDMLHSARFADTAPAEAWATLLDEGTYLGSVSTYYRVLREAGESRERRAQAAHPAAVKPELAATGPNQVYSWDITKLHGPAKWTYYHLYVILDIYSRYAVGWMVATRESAALAEKLIAATFAAQHIAPRQLTIHPDRGSSMTSKPVALLLPALRVP